MWNFYKKHKTYDHADPKELKKQIDGAYHAGMAGNEKVEAYNRMALVATNNINALNRTLEMFADLNPSRTLVRLSREKLAQEQKWLAHYEKCIENTKRGYAQLVVNSAKIAEKAFADGKSDMEKHIKARVQEERATAARLVAEAAEKARVEREKNKGNNNNRDRDNNNNRDRDNNNNRDRDRGNDKSKGDRRVMVIEKMVVKEVDGGKKGDKGDKKKKKVFHQLECK